MLKKLPLTKIAQTTAYYSHIIPIKSKQFLSIALSNSVADLLVTLLKRGRPGFEASKTHDTRESVWLICIS